MNRKDLDLAQPIEIADRIFWVGYVHPNDPFQCHVYLIENGEESVLIDPGSMITFPMTLRKISSVTPLKNIKYLIAHHQDPDITGCIRALERMIPRKDKFIVTHWRTQALLKHYDWETPFWLVDEHNWELTLKGGRKLQFIFTPYAHFAGAFCTYDEKTGTLFSSDIFGGFTEEFSLFATDESYFEAMRPFHEHYMPSKDILNYALKRIEEKHPTMIAPQHGSIITEELIQPVIEKLRGLDCGLYLIAGHDTDIMRLSTMNKVLKGIVDSIAMDRRLTESLPHIRELFAEMVDVSELMIIGRAPPNELVVFSSASENQIFKLERDDWEDIKPTVEGLLNTNGVKVLEGIDLPQLGLYESKVVVFPLKDSRKKSIGAGLAILKPGAEVRHTSYMDLIGKFSVPLSASLERELSIIMLEEERERVYKAAVEDALTGLYNRFYMRAVEKEFYNARRYGYPFSVIMFDIDHFKKVNDTYGHLIGDFVLKGIARIIKKNTRKGDFAIRYGGEELLLVTPFTDKKAAYECAEKIRAQIEKKTFHSNGIPVQVTVSAGIGELEGEESLAELIEKADEKLYQAKESGRNRVVA